MRVFGATLFAILILTAGAAQAQGPGSYVESRGFYTGPQILHAYFVASDTCQKVTSIRRGAPSGRSVGPDTIPVTVTIGPNPRGCGKSRLVTGTMPVGGPQSLIELFFVDQSGRLLKTERISKP